MKCEKCGAPLEPNARFCGFCRHEIQPEVKTPTPVQPIEPVAIPKMEQASMPISNSNKKKGKKPIFVVVAILLIVALIGSGVFYFTRQNDSKTNVLEQVLKATGEKAKESGTIKANVSLGAKAVSIDLSATSKYAKEGDKYSLALSIDKNMFIDQVSAYFITNGKNIELYAPSTIIDLIGMTSSDKNQWVKYSMDLEENDIIEEEIKTNSDYNISDFIDEEHFVYKDKENNIKHYQLIIDQKLIDKIKEELSKIENEEFKDLKESLNNEDMKLSDPINIDFYINSSNVIEKISFDMTKLIKQEDIDKAVVSIELSDLGKTTVTVPSDAKNSSVSLEDYILNNSTMGGYEDYGSDYNYGSDYSW